METVDYNDHKHYRLAKNRFVVMIVGSIGGALLLVVFAMWLYTISGAAQVDLSRPGYQDVRDQVVDERSLSRSFPGSGRIDEKALMSFQELFDTTSLQINRSDSFTGTQLDNETLGIGN